MPQFSATVLLSPAVAEAVNSILEVVASERGDCIFWLLDALKSSPARFVVLNLESEWQADSPKAFAALLIKAASDLDRLERRSGWRHPRHVVESPHIFALSTFAWARRSRISGVVRGRRLDVIVRKLQSIYDQERQKRQLENFLGGPGQPIDPGWLREFLKTPREDES